MCVCGGGGGGGGGVLEVRKMSTWKQYQLTYTESILAPQHSSLMNSFFLARQAGPVDSCSLRCRQMLDATI